MKNTEKAARYMVVTVDGFVPCEYETREAAEAQAVLLTENTHLLWWVEAVKG